VFCAGCTVAPAVPETVRPLAPVALALPEALVPLTAPLALTDPPRAVVR
jgi:hypothetical protein